MRAPAWASFFDDARWGRFLGAVGTDLQKRGRAHQIDGDAGCVRLASGEVLGLTNLAQMCFQAPDDRWAHLIEHHFGLAVAPSSTEADAIAADFNRARSVIKIRLWDRANLPSIPLVAWDLADDLVAVLTLDLPEMLVTLKRDDAERWPVSKADLWHLGLANVRRDGLLAAPAVDIGNGTMINVLEGDSTFFAASHVLFVDAYAGPAPHGALVAVPRRHTMVFHTIRNRRVVDAVTSMINVVPRMCHEGPGSITTSLYWWRPGHALLLLPMSANADGIDFHPPPPFVDLLDRLR